MAKSPHTIIDQYIADQPEPDRARLQQLREIIAAAAPAASEKISWGMPTFYLNGNLVHFANGKTHTGLYPGAEPIERLAGKLEGYKTSKGAIQLPKSQPLPVALIQEVVALCVARNAAE